MANFIIEWAAQALILRNIRENKWGNSARRQMREFLPLVLHGMETGIIEIVDNKYYDSEYHMVGTIAHFGDREDDGFYLADEVAQDYIRNRTISEIASDITTKIIELYQQNNGVGIKAGMRLTTILRGGEWDAMLR